MSYNTARSTSHLSHVASVFLALIALAACGGGSSTAEPDASGSSSGAVTLQTRVDYAAPARRLDVTATLDVGAVQELDVPLTGAMLAITGGNGTRYTLVIPADALRTPTRIRMQAVTRLEGLPSGIVAVHGVQFEPSGLQFMAPAALTIEPASAIPVAQQAFYAYEGTGHDLHPVPGELGTAAQLKVMHFSGYGMATLERERSVSGVFVDVVPAGLEARLEAAAANAFQQARDGKITNGQLFATLDALLTQYETEVLKPMHAAAGKSCANALKTLTAELTVRRMRQLTGLGGTDNGLVLETMRTLRKVCFEEANKRCRVSGNIEELIVASFGLRHQAALVGDDDAADTALEETAIDHCGRYELEFDSTVTYDGIGANSTVGFGRLSVSTRVPLKLSGGPDKFLEGEAEIAHTDTATRFNCSFKGCGYYLVKGTRPDQATVTLGRPVFRPLQGIDTWALGTPVAQTGNFRVEFDPHGPSESIDVVQNAGPILGIINVNAAAGAPPSRETLWAGFYSQVNSGEIGPNGSYMWDSDWTQASYPVMFERATAPSLDNLLTHLVAITRVRLLHKPI